MKKLWLLSVTLFSLVAISTLGFAREKVDTVEDSFNGRNVHVKESSVVGKMRTASVGIESSGNSSAVQFMLTLPKDARLIDTSGCLANLPATHTGVCKTTENRVAAVIYSAQNEPLPKGFVSVGFVKFESSVSGDISVEKYMESENTLK